MLNYNYPILNGFYFMNEKPPASIALEKLGIPHRIFRHETPVDSFEQAASDRNQRPEQVVRSILFQVRSEEFAMALDGRTRTGGLEEFAQTRW